MWWILSLREHPITCFGKRRTPLTAFASNVKIATDCRRRKWPVDGRSFSVDLSPSLGIVTRQQSPSGSGGIFPRISCGKSGRLGHGRSVPHRGGLNGGRQRSGVLQRMRVTRLVARAPGSDIVRQMAIFHDQMLKVMNEVMLPGAAAGGDSVPLLPRCASEGLSRCL